MANFSAGSFTVKAYLGETTPEIRRFTLDQDVVTNFVYVREKIAAMFPSLSNSPFKVFWRDPEGDLVAVSSDEELMEAISHGVADGMLKLYLRVVGENQENHFEPTTASDSKPGLGTPTKPIHPGVTCDACDGQVIGIRFKCLVCPDYDLCEMCCDKGFHSHHYMLRMPKPATDFARGAFHGPQGCRRGQGRQSGWGNFAEYGGRNWKRFWKNMMRYHPGYTGEPGAAAAENDPSTSTSQPKPTECPQADGQREYLQHVGEQVATLLEPLGINVDVGVDTHPNSGQCTAGSYCCQRDAANFATAAKPESTGTSTGNNSCTRGGACKPDDNCMKNCTGARPKTPPAAQAAAPMEQDADELSWIKVESKDQDMDVIVIEKKDKPPTDQSTAPSAPSLAAEPRGATAPSPILLDTPIPIVYPPVSAGLYPSLPHKPNPSGPASTELEKRVAEAVEQMKSMGFHDERGWMTAMLYQHDGDVHKVIDTVLRQAQDANRQ